MAILDDIFAYLVAQGVATTDGASPPEPGGAWPLYLSYIPDDQDQMQCCFEIPGKPAGTQLSVNEEFGFQYRVRGSRLNYQIARAQWKSGFDALQNSQPNSAFALVLAQHMGPVTFNDDKGRPNFISNFRANRLVAGS